MATDDEHDHDGPTEESIDLANKLICDVELRRAVDYCDRCTAVALLLAATRVGQICGLDLDELCSLVHQGYVMSRENPPRPDETLLN